MRERKREEGEGGREEERESMGVVPLRFDCAYSFVSVTSLVSARHHLSTLVATDLRETLHDTILDAVKGEDMQQGMQSVTISVFSPRIIPLKE